MTSYNLFSGASEVVSPPVALNLSPRRDGIASWGDHAVERMGEAVPRLRGIIASPRLGFHPGNTCFPTTKIPDLPERERPKQLRAGFFGFLFLALGLPAMKYGAASSKSKDMGGGGACDSGFCFLSGLSLRLRG